MTRFDLFSTSLARTKSLHARRPEDLSIRSIIIQLEYLTGLEAGKREDRERLKDIIIGILTVREIEPLDIGLAELLYKVVDEVETMKGEDKSLATYRPQPKP